jgi:DNA polymerase elongation subunit (family B)
MAWRNIFYNGKEGTIHLWTWDEDGNRIKTVSSFEPYLFIEKENGEDGKSIFNTSLKKVKFQKNFDRSRFVNETPLTRLYHNLNCEQQFLLDSFKNDLEKPEFGQHSLKIAYLDIETESKGKFSTPEEATDPVNLITVYDNFSEKFYTWGLKHDYDTDNQNVVYVNCGNERELLEKFLTFWEKEEFDIVTGWNSTGYDIPYLINRISKRLSEDDAKRLSPVKRLFLKENASVNKLGRSINRWIIYGISHLDYMEVYQTFTLGDRESYSLNYIGEYELNEGKVAYSQTSLTDLAEQDWNKFVDYNIQDVNILIKLEQKMKLLGIVRKLSYKGFIPFEKAMGKVSLITGAIAHQALLEDKYLPTYNSENTKVDFEGGYVKEPIPGLYENVVTYDANSLYPNTILTLNISPETKIGKVVHSDDNEKIIRLSSGKEVTIPNEKFDKLLNIEKLSLSKANVLYSQKNKGIVPKFIEKINQERTNAKNEMIKYKKLLSKIKDEDKKKRAESIIIDNDIHQSVIKVLSNSVYGVFSQKFSPLFDIDHASSITLTGQNVVKEAGRLAEVFHKNNNVELKDSTCIYSDTDSVNLSVDVFFKQKNISLVDEQNQITPDANKIILELGDYINENIKIWAEKELNSIDPRYFFKREAICDVALYVKKKNYILHVLDQEGVYVNKFKYVGIEVVKSTMSKEVKELIKHVIEKALLSKDRKLSNEILTEGYDEFCKLTYEQVGFRKKVNDYEKYVVKRGEPYKKGSPIHNKAAMNYNWLLNEYNIDGKYIKIGNGTKIKFFYCQKNKYNYQVVGFLDYFPEELKEIIKPDYRFMFDKLVTPLIQRIYTVIGWNVPNVTQQPQTDIFELFG